MAGTALGKRLRCDPEGDNDDDGDDELFLRSIYVGTHIKHSKTSAPVDLGAAKAAKKEARHATKKRSGTRAAKEEAKAKGHVKVF
jgi:hypothetical protein